MTRQMADSVTSADIPRGAFAMVAGYVDGAYAWSYNDWAIHADAVLVRITVLGNTLDAHVADVENGDLTPAEGADWCKRMLAAGKYPTLYFSLGLWPQVKAALEAAVGNTGLVGAWVALWDNGPYLNPGWLAHQYANPALTFGHYDLSVVADYWPGVDPAPVPAPAPVSAPVPVAPPPLAPPVPVAPPPAPVAPIDQTRSAWSGLADFLTSAVPDFIREILRLLGLFQKTP